MVLETEPHCRERYRSDPVEGALLDWLAVCPHWSTFSANLVRPSEPLNLTAKLGLLDVPNHQGVSGVVDFRLSLLSRRLLCWMLTTATTLTSLRSRVPSGWPVRLRGSVEDHAWQHQEQFPPTFFSGQNSTPLPTVASSRATRNEVLNALSETAEQSS